jgi:hypothetical protein
VETGRRVFSVKPKKPSPRSASRRQAPPRSAVVGRKPAGLEVLCVARDGEAQQRRLLAVADRWGSTPAPPSSFLSSFLSALCAVGHVHANADAASRTAASAVRIFHLGPSLQRLAKYNATANALANATATLTSTERGISRLSLAAREKGSEKLPRKYVSLGRHPSFRRPRSQR